MQEKKGRCAFNAYLPLIFSIIAPTVSLPFYLSCAKLARK